jgi:hypothetical protein
MSSDAVKALQCETDFLSGVKNNLEAAKGKVLRGVIWQWSEHDEKARLKGLMAEHRNYDYDLLQTLPANRRIVLHGFERRWWFGKRPTGVAIASVLCPLRSFASGTKAPSAIGLGELTDHVRQLTSAARVPHVIGVCSPTGFTTEAKAAQLSTTHVTVVLIEPDGRGGWQTSPAGTAADARVVKMFDPEGQKQKSHRVRKLLEERSADLLTGGLTASAVADELQLPEAIVREAFVLAEREDPELKSAKRDGEFLLFRGAPAVGQEKRAMGVIDRIKQLFSNEGRESEKINLLAERRAALARRRDRIYEDIGKLEQREADLLTQGKATKSEVPRRRLAAQLAQMRKDIARQNTTAAMLNQQINIISTDIHNLTLIQQGQLAQLPATEELTENAVKAEEMLETLRADSELVGGLTTGLSELTTSEEELAILREFDEEGTKLRAPKAEARTSHEGTKASEPRASARAEAQGTKRRSEDPGRVSVPDEATKGNAERARERGAAADQFRDRAGTAGSEEPPPSKSRNNDAEAV